MRLCGVSLSAKRRLGPDTVVHYAGRDGAGVLCNAVWTPDDVASDNRSRPICLHCKREAKKLRTR